ncbi:MAG TPA: hypothetical protein V6C88_20755 [Chroococcidiopsis sp.]
MNDNSDSNKQQFLNPLSTYYGEGRPEKLAFNANLQEFANRVLILCSLETGGKITPEEAYTQIRDLWHQLKESKKTLLDAPPLPRPELPPDE